MHKKTLWFNISAYSLAHVLVDAACAAVLFAIVSPNRFDPQSLFQFILIYDVIAFSTQPVFGLFVDQYKTPAHVAALGILLVATSTLMMGVPVLAAVIAGIGNAVFHVAGGRVSLELAPGKAFLPGVFVAPGALGLTIGIMIGKSGGFIAWPFFILLLVLTVVILIIPRPVVPLFHALPGNQGWFEVVILLLLLSVAIRSLVGQSLILPWKSAPTLLLALTVAVVLGKCFGGIRYGWTTVAIFGHLPVQLEHAGNPRMPCRDAAWEKRLRLRIDGPGFDRRSSAGIHALSCIDRRAGFYLYRHSCLRCCFVWRVAIVSSAFS